MKFTITNPDGSPVTVETLVWRNEPWIDYFAECRQFAISDDGRVLVLDAFGHYYEAPVGRFIVIWEAK